MPQLKYRGPGEVSWGPNGSPGRITGFDVHDFTLVAEGIRRMHLMGRVQVVIENDRPVLVVSEHEPFLDNDIIVPGEEPTRHTRYYLDDLFHILGGV